MNPLLNWGEYITSQLAYPRSIVWVGNKLFNGQNIQLGEGATIARHCRLRGDITLGPGANLDAHCTLFGDVTLGPNVDLGEDCRLTGNIEIGKQTNQDGNFEVIGDVTIGKYCALARRVLFQQRDHKMTKPGVQMDFYRNVLESKLEHTNKGQIIVGNDVWIGTRAIILSGVSIGDGAVIGAGSIVTKDVEPYVVVAGVPAERVNWRFNAEIREKLLEIEWWNAPESVLREHAKFFDRELVSSDDIPKQLYKNPYKT